MYGDCPSAPGCGRSCSGYRRRSRSRRPCARQRLWSWQGLAREGRGIILAACPSPFGPPTTEDKPMQQLCPDLWQTTAEHPFGPDVTTHAYLWCGPAGNVLFYNTGLADEIEAMAALGGVAWQYLSHRDEVSPSLATIHVRFGTRLRCHALEAPAAQAVTPVDATFDAPHLPLPGLEVIPTPATPSAAPAFGSRARPVTTCSPATACFRTAMAGAPTSVPISAPRWPPVSTACAHPPRRWCWRRRRVIHTVTASSTPLSGSTFSTPPSPTCADATSRTRPPPYTAAERQN